MKKFILKLKDYNVVVHAKSQSACAAELKAAGIVGKLAELDDAAAARVVSCAVNELPAALVGASKTS